jgi:hypothetical protein
MTYSAFNRVVGAGVGASRVADKATDASKIGSGLADWGEDVIMPWLAKTAQADHLGGKALRGLGWIGKQHSKIPGYDWMESQLANLGGGVAGAFGVDPRIGMLVGTVLMPDATDFVPGVGGALGTSAKLARKSAGKVGKLLPKANTSLFNKIYDPDVARVLNTYSEANLHKGMTTAKNAVPIVEKHKVPRVAFTKTGMAKKARMETVDGVEQAKRYAGASDKIPQDMPRRYQDMIPLTPEEAAGFGARKFDVEKIPADDTLRTGISEEWNRLLDERNAVIDAEWVKYMEIVDRLDNWPVDELGNPKVFYPVSISPKTGKMKQFSRSTLKYSHVESQRVNQLRRVRDLRASPIDAAVQDFINNFHEGFNKAIKGRIDEFFETVYYPSLMRTALMMAVDPSAKLDLVNLPKGMLKKAIAAQKDGSVLTQKLAPGAIDDAIKAAYAPGGAATRKGWWATPEQLEMLELYAKEMP